MECKIYALHSGTSCSSLSLASKRSCHGTKQFVRCYFCAGDIVIIGMSLQHLKNIYIHILEFYENLIKLCLISMPP